MMETEDTVPHLLNASRTLVSEAEYGKLRSEEHTSELQSQSNLVCRLLLDSDTYLIYTLSLSYALPIFKLRAVQLLDRCLCFGVARHFDEAEALALTGVTIADDGNRRHGAAFAERFADTGFGSRIWQVADVKFSAHGTSRGSALAQEHQAPCQADSSKRSTDAKIIRINAVRRQRVDDFPGFSPA